MSATQFFQAHTLAEAIKTRRDARSLKQAAAEIGGVSYATLSLLENERASPSLVLLLSICRWLGRPVTDFIGDSPLPLPNELAQLVREKRARAELLRQEAERFRALAQQLDERVTTGIRLYHAGNPSAEAYIRNGPPGK